MAATEAKSLMRSAMTLPLVKESAKKSESQDFMMFFVKFKFCQDVI
jgi:hypothetical protein